MRYAPSGAAVRKHTTPNHQRHPWLHALELFAVPFFCYSADGRCTYMSTSAKQLVDAAPDGLMLSRQADHAVADELQRSQPCVRLGQLALVRQLPSCSPTLTLALYLARPSLDGVSAVVIAYPRAEEPPSDSQIISGLTPRECEIARLIATGLPTKTIAAQLGISSHTARHHIERLYSKLGVHSRAGIASLIGPRMGRSAHVPVAAPA